MGKDAVTEAEAILGKGTISTPENLLGNADLEERAVRAYHRKLWLNIVYELGRAHMDNIKTYLGKEINNIPLTPSGLIAGSHLIGAYNIVQYIKNNGKPQDDKQAESFFDGNGKHVEQYMAAHADYDLSKITKMPHKEWGIGLFLKKNSKNINQKKRDDFAAKKHHGKIQKK